MKEEAQGTLIASIVNSTHRQTCIFSVIITSFFVVDPDPNPDWIRILEAVLRIRIRDPVPF